MKRNYFEPEMKISTFSPEDVVTTSATGLTGASINNNATEADYSAARVQAVLDYTQFTF